MARSHRLSLADYALREGLTYHQVRARLLRGELKGGKDELGRYYIRVRSPAASPRQPAPQAGQP